MPFRFSVKTIFLTLAVFLTACSSMQPDLSRLYEVDQWGLLESHQIKDKYVQPPVIVIPGIVSSTLVNEEGEEVWFGPWYRSLFANYETLALELDAETLLPKPSKIRAGHLPERVLVFDFYGSLFEVLESYGNYQYTQVGTAHLNNRQLGEDKGGSGRRYYQFAYDWRYDSVDTVRKLDAFIESIRRDYGDPDLKVDLIAHSMGGLIARYYMRYGTVDVLNDNDFPVTQAGAQKVRRFIQLGSPNLGSVAALHQLIEGYKVVFGTVPVEVLATMPSVYQLLPHPLNTWLVNIEGKPLKRDLYDVELWRRLEWGIFNPSIIQRILSNFDSEEAGNHYVDLLQRYFAKYIERARRFVWSLTVPVPNIDYSIVAFGGNCSPTPARMLVEDIEGESFFRLWPHQVKSRLKHIDYKRLMLEPGDGRVTKPSMLARHFLHPELPRHKYSFFPLDYAFFLCHNHGQLTGNINFQDNLLNVLLERTQDDISHSEAKTLMGR